MIVQVNGATASQEATVRSVLEGEKLTWDTRRIATTITVTMLDEVDAPGNGVDEVANATYYPESDSALINIERRVAGDAGEFRRIIAHELAHVVIAHLDEATKRWISETAFGKSPHEEHWDSGDWFLRTHEAASEAFVDAFLVDTDHNANKSRLRVIRERWAELVAWFQFDVPDANPPFALESLTNPVRATDWVKSNLIPATQEAWDNTWFQRDPANDGYLTLGGDNYICRLPRRFDVGQTVEIVDGGLWRWVGTPGVNEGGAPYYAIPRSGVNGKANFGMSPEFRVNLHGFLEASAEPGFTAPKDKVPLDPPSYYVWRNRIAPWQIVQEPYSADPYGNTPYAGDPESCTLDIAASLTEGLAQPFEAGDDIYIRLWLPNGLFASRAAVIGLPPADQHNVAWEMVRSPLVAQSQELAVVQVPYPGYSSTQPKADGKLKVGGAQAGSVIRRRLIAG